MSKRILHLSVASLFELFIDFFSYFNWITSTHVLGKDVINYKIR